MQENLKMIKKRKIITSYVCPSHRSFIRFCGNNKKLHEFFTAYFVFYYISEFETVNLPMFISTFLDSYHLISLLT